MASFVLRRIDDALWNRFRVLAAAEGVTTKDLLLRLITAYVQSKADARAQPIYTDCPNCGTTDHDAGAGADTPLARAIAARVAAHYPPDWPKCRCGLPVMDGHLTCGKLACDEAGARVRAARPCPSRTGGGRYACELFGPHTTHRNGNVTWTDEARDAS